MRKIRWELKIKTGVSLTDILEVDDNFSDVEITELIQSEVFNLIYWDWWEENNEDLSELW